MKARRSEEGWDTTKNFLLVTLRRADGTRRHEWQGSNRLALP